MNKQSTLVLTAVALTAIYVFFFIDWNKKKTIQISCRCMPSRFQGDTPKLMFYLDKPARLAWFKVYSEEEAATNKYPHSFWHLVSKKKDPRPVDEITYGFLVPGMKSDVPQARPEPLKPGAKYRMVVQDADDVKGELTFTAPDLLARR